MNKVDIWCFLRLLFRKAGLAEGKKIEEEAGA